MDYQIKAEEFMKIIGEYNKLKKNHNSTAPDKGAIAVMGILSCNQEMYAYQLAKELNLSRARLSLIVKKLKSKDYITSRFMSTDKRKILIKITEKGLNLVKDTYIRTLKKISAIFEKLGEEKTITSINLLNDVMDIYKEDKEGELLKCLD